MFTYLFLILCISAPLAAAPLSLEQVMTEEELKSTGMQNASPQQKQALESWISAWTLRVIEQAPTYRPGTDLSTWVQRWPSYLQPKSSSPSEQQIAERLRQNARVDKVRNEGAIIELKDGSVWQISPLYTYLTVIWQKGEQVVFEKSENYLYKFRMRNVVRNEVAECNLKEAASPSGEKKEPGPEYYTGSQTLVSIDGIGENLLLSDNTFWKIAPVDMFKAKNWHTNDRVRVEKVDNFLYHYRLTNLDNGEVVLANKDEKKW